MFYLFQKFHNLDHVDSTTKEQINFWFLFKFYLLLNKLDLIRVNLFSSVYIYKYNQTCLWIVVSDLVIIFEVNRICNKMSFCNFWLKPVWQLKQKLHTNSQMNCRIRKNEASSHYRINMTKFWFKFDQEVFTMTNLNNWTWPKNIFKMYYFLQ